MVFRFLHLADVHLGYRQYGIEERYADFGLAFQQAVQTAILQHVDFVLVAGDLFHKHSIDPQTLYQATVLLAPLKEHHIPLLAVIGNHDNPRFEEGMSWLDYLSATGQIILLDARVKDKQLAVLPWDPVQLRGTYYDLPCGARVIGMRYYGTSTPRVLESYTRAMAELAPAPYTILMMHTGLQGTMNYDAPAVSRSQLEPLRPYADYIALGHFHKPFEQDGWIYNPGSLETVSVDESAWEDRGYLLANVDSNAKIKHSVKRMAGLRRQFIRINVQADTIMSPSEMGLALQAQVKRNLALINAHAPVVEVGLHGALQFDHSLLDINALETAVKQVCQPLTVRISDMTSVDSAEIGLPESLTRSELEQQVLTELVKRETRLRGQDAAWSSFVSHIKAAVLANMAPDEMARELHAFINDHPLETTHAD